MHDDVTIRHYRPDDLEACRALWVALTDWHRHIYDSESIGGDDPGRQFDEHLERVGAENLWLAEIDGRVVGLTGMIPGDGEAEVEPVVVCEDARRRGIGRALVAAVIEAAREAGVRHLNVRPVARNASALRFFRGMGFDVVGHVGLFMDFKPAGEQRWIDGEQLGGASFRV